MLQNLWQRSQTHAVNSLEDDLDSEKLLPGTDPMKTWSISRQTILLTGFNLIVFALSLLVSLFHLTSNPSLDKYGWSPIDSLPLVRTQVRGSFFPPPGYENDSSAALGRLPPSPASDVLWQDIELQRPIALSRSDLLKMGKDPSKVIRLPNDEFGLAPDAEMYLGGMDIFHQLHCFNAIREAAFADYYFDPIIQEYHLDAYGPNFTPPARGNKTELYWIHLRHCVDIIVQALQCAGDTSMITYTWKETQNYPWPDFNVNKQCTDFEAMKRYRDENALDQKALSMEMPKNGWQVDQDEQYWELFGKNGVGGDNRHHPLWD